MANLRTIDYKGFDVATGSIAPGFLLWSGSLALSQSSETYVTTYDGLGMEVIANSESYFRFRSNPNELDIRTRKFVLGTQTAGGAFISGSGDGTIAISSSNFHLTEVGDLTMQGVITAEAGGTIGGWVIGTSALSSSNDAVLLDSNGPYHIKTQGFLVDAAGAITASAGKIAGWRISGNSLKSAGATGVYEGIVLDGQSGLPSITIGKDSNDYISTFYGNVSAYGILARSGGTTKFQLGSTNEIAGWTFTDEAFEGGRMHMNKEGYISSSGAGGWMISSSNAEADPVGFISSSKFKVSADGRVTASAATIEGKITAGSGEIGGWTIESDKLSKGTDADYIALIPGTGIQMGDSTFADAPFSVTNAGLLKAESGTVAGWTLSDDKFTGGNIIISSSGDILTSNFISSIVGSGQGFKIGADGIAEFEEARIRGTLSTAVFEKETVSAVGGALIVANATALKSGSLILSGSIATASVDSAAGFVSGEYILAKATSSTGFTEEIMKVHSVDLSANTMVVTRSMNGNLIPSMSAGQVLVSQGTNGTGFILLNATSGSETPYIDITERTGSGVNDLQIKSRLGDLSGITDTSFSDDVTGFGLYTQNGYFKGKIEIGSRAAQAPNDKLFLHYNFHSSTNNKIISQTPTLFTGSYSAPEQVNFAVPGAVTITGSSELQGPLSINANEFTSSVAAGQNKFSAGFRLSFASESMDKNVFITRNFPRFVVYKQSNNNVQLRIFSGSNTYDAADIQGISFAVPAGTIKENDLYHIFVTAKENDIASLDVYNITSGSYVAGATESVNFTNSTDHTFGWPDNDSAGGAYVEWEHGAPGWAGSNDISFHGTFHDIRYYKDTVLTNTQMEAIATNTDAASGGTIIDGDSIQTGKIRSNNFGASAGSELDLDGGTIKLGGSSAPAFAVNSLGEVTASAGKIANFVIDGHSLSTTGVEINDSTQTLFISSSNFKVDHIGAVTASNLFLSGSARAVSFSEKLVTIGSGNKSTYFQNYTSGGDDFTRIVLDGSLGGEQTMNIQLDVDTDHPIGDFKFTDQGTGFKQECTVTINAAGVTFNDGQIPSSYADMAK